LQHDTAGTLIRSCCLGQLKIVETTRAACCCCCYGMFSYRVVLGDAKKKSSLCVCRAQGQGGSSSPTAGSRGRGPYSTFVVLVDEMMLSMGFRGERT
jgi:hypothetical protein